MRGVTALLGPLKYLLLAAALLYPLTPVSDVYVLHVVVLVMVYMVLAMGLNILPGFCGLLDLGYVGFYGIGAYTAGLLTLNYDLSFWVIVPLAVINGALWGVILGAPTLRLVGDYFAIVTFGFSELVVLFLTNEIWLTRGPLGLPGIAPVSLDISWLSRLLNPEWNWKYTFSGEIPYYYLGMVMVFAVYVVMRRVEDSRLGRAWLAIREDPLAAASTGVNLFAYKVIAFAVSTGIGALAGSFFARWTMFLSPDMFKFWESFLVLCMVVLGGLGNINGALIGAAVLISLGEVLRVALPQLGLPAETRFLVYGLIMVLIMRFRPGGFFTVVSESTMKSPLIIDLRRRLAARKAG
ncbi:branched-chain amino acid ABC transporter permease [Desulfolutivibrio sulfoxidireducens]|uniref:branched-chain amino acid ABC transporter permease n=1 Tax=Desulfolutivibrio sulfoxidireducens TaxID=2773299 RepID=UPI00159E1533|nr:branched-chain amino acid ABC transporter permease [Desulfolutivibrio sulfoxidireducens]QLA15597.1 branched-chain amino acid ABC transporter permease [Desulfolutivibrio sulfoxidireducens]QLA19200.1 branched-chain amino acid ABC transporter permease [Desulfolutivibrio sulfoxidireducens]